MTMHRREIITAGGVLFWTGCIDITSNAPKTTDSASPNTESKSANSSQTRTPASSDTSTHTDHRVSVITTEEKNLSGQEEQDNETLQFDDLPKEEQNLVKKALPNKTHFICDIPPDESPWWKFAHRPEKSKAYLEHRQEYYELWVRIGDQLFMDTGDTPSKESISETCGGS